MSIKKIIQDFYKSDALINCEVMKTFLHPEVIIEWNSSKGFITMKYDAILSFTSKLEKAYSRSKAKISHIVADPNQVAVRYSHYIKTIENPREEMLVAHCFVIWELKDSLLFRGFQISQMP